MNLSDKPHLLNDQLIAIKTEIKAGRMINAIKLVRDYTGLGLKESKDYADKMKDEIDGKRNS